MTLILALPQTMSIPRRSRGTLFTYYSNSIMMTSNEFKAALKRKQERWERGSQRGKKKREVSLEITKKKSKGETKKGQIVEDKKLRVEECAEEHGIMWPTKRCPEASVKLHEAIKTYEPLGMGIYPCCGVVHRLSRLNKKVS